MLIIKIVLWYIISNIIDLFLLLNHLQESQGALVETESERNTLRRQLARMSKKYEQAAGTPRDSSIPEDGDAEDAAQLEDDQEGSITESEESSHNQQQFLEDAEKEVWVDTLTLLY